MNNDINKILEAESNGISGGNLSKKPFISYLITTKNEGNQIKELYNLLSDYITGNEIVFIDDYSTDSHTLTFYSDLKWAEIPGKLVQFHQHHLDGDYGGHKNFGIEQCRGEWIFQIDADELPVDNLLAELPGILKTNFTTELFWISRINKFVGVTEENAKQWGWNIDNPGKWINWNTGDYQTRIFKNLPYIRWNGRLHERIMGNKTYAFLPKDEDYALIHTKTIAKQIQTNLRYNKEFTKEDNLGLSSK